MLNFERLDDREAPDACDDGACERAGRVETGELAASDGILSATGSSGVWPRSGDATAAAAASDSGLSGRLDSQSVMRSAEASRDDGVCCFSDGLQVLGGVWRRRLSCCTQPVVAASFLRFILRRLRTVSVMFAGEVCSVTWSCGQRRASGSGLEMVGGWQVGLRH